MMMMMVPTWTKRLMSSMAARLPGLPKVNMINVPAKKKRTGSDPFTKQERVFAAKPATVKIKTRALKKLKDAAL